MYNKYILIIPNCTNRNGSLMAIFFSLLCLGYKKYYGTASKLKKKKGKLVI